LDAWSFLVSGSGIVVKPHAAGGASAKQRLAGSETGCFTRLHGRWES
jgi:hypothetical protein